MKEILLSIIWVLCMMAAINTALFNLYVLFLNRSLTWNPWLNVVAFFLSAQFPVTQIIKAIKFYRQQRDEDEDEDKTAD